MYSVAVEKTKNKGAMGKIPPHIICSLFLNWAISPNYTYKLHNLIVLKAALNDPTKQLSQLQLINTVVSLPYASGEYIFCCSC